MEKSNEIHDNIPIYNSRIIHTYLKLVQKKYSYINIDELLSYAEIKHYEVTDSGHWFTQRQTDLFHEKLVQLTGNINISREAGKYAASPEALGHIGHWIKGFLNPVTAFSYFSQIVSRFTLSTVYETVKINSKKVEIRVSPKENVNEKKYQCQNRLGHFEAIVSLFNCTGIRIDHPECIFQGDKHCRYIISWKQPLYATWEKIRNSVALIFVAVISYIFYIKPQVASSVVLPSFILIFLLLEVIFLRKDKNEQIKALNNLQHSSSELIEQSNLYYNNALLTSEIGETLAKQTDKSSLFEYVIEILKERLDYDRGIILIANQDQTKLEFEAGYGYSQKEYEIIKNTSFHLKEESKGAFVVCYKENRSLLVNDIDSIKNHLTEKSLDFAKRLGGSSFICCPITHEGNAYGVLAVDNVQTKRPLVARDVNLLNGVAHFLGISIRNIDLIESKERQFGSLLRVLAASIDARDTMTAGHSEKVTQYALGICEELGIGQESQYLIRVAALLHDYGKIGVPDSILKKPGALTKEEYAIVKTHAIKTEKILSQIAFEGVLEQVPKIAGSHHERIDGSGYPYGLKGDQIPWEAKIIAVADFFEAISAKRHYRNPMPMAKAFDLLYEQSGNHFDHEIVNALYRYYSKNIGKVILGYESEDIKIKKAL